MISRAGFLKSSVGSLLVPPHEEPADHTDIYENVLWAFDPILEATQPGEVISATPYQETHRRLKALVKLQEIKANVESELV